MFFPLPPGRGSIVLKHESGRLGDPLPLEAKSECDGG